MEFSHELVLPNDDLPFKMFLFEGKDGNYRRDKHWHRSVEIFAVTEGSLEFYINESHTHLSSGEFIIVNSNEIHSVTAPVSNRTVVLQIPLKAFENYYTKEEFVCFAHGDCGREELVMQLIHRMFETYAGRGMGYEFKVQSDFYELLYYLVTDYRNMEVSEDVVRKRRNLNKLSAITSYIKENYAGEITLESLSRKFGYSPAYLSRMFQKYANTNFKTYLQNVRMEYAGKELLNTETPIGEVAQNNGFPDSRALCRAFKKQFDILPSEYRKTKNGYQIDKFSVVVPD